MKFGLYLERNLTPEWKRVYINYKRLKKLIKPIEARVQNEANSKVLHKLATVHDDSEEEGSSTGQDTSTHLQKKTKRSRSIAGDKVGKIAKTILSPISDLQTEQSSPKSFKLGKPALKQNSTKYGSFDRTPPFRERTIPEPPKLVLQDSSADSLDPPTSYRAAAGASSRSDIRPLRPSTLSTFISSSRDDPTSSPTSTAVNDDLAAGSSQPQPFPLPSASYSLAQPTTLLVTPPPPLRYNESEGERTAVDSSDGARSSKKVDDDNNDNDDFEDDGGANVFQAGDEENQFGQPSPKTNPRWRRGSHTPRRSSTKTLPLQLSDIIPTLHPDETAFLKALDEELDKVETFFKARVQVARGRADVLIKQGKELKEHRRVFHAIHDNPPVSIFNQAGHFAIPSFANLHHHSHGRTSESNDNNYGPSSSKISLEKLSVDGHALKGNRHLTSSETHLTTSHLSQQNAMSKDSNDDSGSIKSAKSINRMEYDPEAYKRYKRRLQAAVLEFFKSLEILKNYRILNVTGFRKALKKFDKASKIGLMDAYFKERVQMCTFSSEHELDQLIQQTEDMYATSFEHGDRKKAKNKLRISTTEGTHHFSTFRSGAYLGLAIPALIHGIVLTFQPQVRQQIPAWGALLQVYSAFLIPVVFAVLIQFNLIAWNAARINYPFIFELDTRQAPDYRQYMELPSFLLFTLAYAFWFSFAEVGAANVSPTTWPLAWFCFALLFIINPLPICQKSARWWLCRSLWRLISPFYSRVEFASFFIADELNSLTYTLSNLWFMSCAYNKHWPSYNTWNQCNANKSWVVGVLLCIPALIRLLQCVQRWRDSGAFLQLINAGKYASSLAVAIFFIVWKARGESQTDPFFIVWCIAGIINSTYTSSWDVWIDMGLLRPDAKFLRAELVYPEEWTPYYYFAIVSNVIIRWIWVGYIPQGGVNIRIKSFIFASLEMLRRFQWNFFRLENEHVGNADQYRVTREMPLPYELHEMSEHESSGDEGEVEHQDESQASSTAYLSRPKGSFKRSNTTGHSEA